MLDRLADQFPNHLRPVARQMNAWPILRHRHTSSAVRFNVLAERLELGADYPLDTRRSARFRPDSPMVQYLDHLVPRLGLVRSLARQHKTDDEKEWIHWWNIDHAIQEGDEEAYSKIAGVLRLLRNMPMLTKANATAWATRVVVPIILLTDAKGSGPYTNKALEQIRRQRDLKSRAMFESRLESKVAKTLRSIARLD